MFVRVNCELFRIEWHYSTRMCAYSSGGSRVKRLATGCLAVKEEYRKAKNKCDSSTPSSYNLIIYSDVIALQLQPIIAYNMQPI